MPTPPTGSRPEYRDPRSEMADLLPAASRSVLDVGCSSGAFGAYLRTVRDVDRIVGVEPSIDAARAARSHYDYVVHGSFPQDVSKLRSETKFDAIYFNDVLEHMSEPRLALDATRDMLNPAGVLIASIPNVRHVSVVGPLLLRGQFRYRSTGILDSTHLRFFTRRSIVELFGDQQWVVIGVQGLNKKLRIGDRSTRPWIRLLSRLTRGRVDEFFYVQYAVTARPASTA